MRFERLVIEADENTFSLDFHPRLTVIAGVGRLEREGLISELVGSLTSSRAGVHAEVMADTGNRFAIFRPHGARARVIDIDASSDVSERFADETGAIDLLSLAGLDERSAKRTLRVTSTDLTTITHHDQIIRRLAAVDASTLWDLAERVRIAQVELDTAAADSGSSPEDAAIAARIEEQHLRFEDAHLRSEKVRKFSFVAGALAALATIPAALWISQRAAMGSIAVAAVVTAISFLQHRRMVSARNDEAEALAAGGADSYLGFHLQRVNGLLDSEHARRQLVEAGMEHDSSMAAWFSLAGDTTPEWVSEYRVQIEEATQRMTEVTSITTNPLKVDDDDAAALAHALMARLEVVRTAGPGDESLPLILDDSLRGIDHDLKAPLLELLLHSSNNQQIVFLTEDTDVADWARVEAITGELSVLEPMAADKSVASDDTS
ncbi:MAG: hypothetical protein P8Q52_10245 [Acidimicrobiales bacterium]|nr:hypothetical protein [Acidimicrobiales bacterium]